MLGPCRWIIIALVGLCLGWHGANSRADELPKAANSQEILAWIEQLDSESFRKREAATRSLQAAGSAVIGPLGQAVGKRGPEVAWRAVVVLKEICISGNAATSDEAAAVLQKLAESGNRSIVADAQRALQSWKLVRHERAIAAITKLGGSVSMSGTTIYRLVLNDNWRGDIDDLRLLTHLNSLAYLDLRGEKFTDKAVPHLVKIAGLGRLNLYSTAITAKGGKTLEAKAPNTKVLWFGSAVLGITGDTTGGGGGKGCRVTSVYPGTGAHKAGLQAGDLITKLDDAAITSFAVLTREMVAKKVDQKVKITVLRGEEKLSLDVTLGGRSQIEQPRFVPGPFPRP
jgi:hypothetical protein